VLVFEYTEPPAEKREVPAAEAISSRPAAFLTLHPDTPQQEVVPLPSEALIGRALTADIVLEESEAAMRHAVVRWDGKQWLIEDLGSASGTAVNDSRLSPHKPLGLHSGDIIRVGKTTIRFDIKEP